MAEDFFNWNDEVEDDGDGWTTLLPGTYEGTITKIEKKRWEGAGKMNGCPYAEVSIKVAVEGGKDAIVTDNLYLSRSMEWKIGMFLSALGLKKKGDPIKASAIDKALHKLVKVVVTCKLDKDHDYLELSDAEQVQSYIDSGVDVYNNVKKYAPSESAEVSDDAFGFEF